MRRLPRCLRNRMLTEFSWFGQSADCSSEGRRLSRLLVSSTNDESEGQL